MQLDIYKLEQRKDWPAIVMGVPCQVCGAHTATPCVEIKKPGPSGELYGGRVRTDYHAERKYAAAQVWYNEQHEKSPSTESPSHPGV